MSEYTLALTREAQNDIRQLTPPVQNRMLEKLRWLAENASLIVHQPLQGEQWAGTFRYRVGDYRIIYLMEVEKSQITVLKIGHRREIYKR